MKRLRALINDELLSSSMISMCTALEVKHVNNNAHRFEVADPPRVFLVDTCHGPNVSTPTAVNGGPGVSLSKGKSAIICSDRFARSFLHGTHLLMTLDTSLLALRSSIHVDVTILLSGNDLCASRTRDNDE